MATQIASLYARIGADTSDFERGLRNSRDALDRIEGGINKVAKVAAVGLGVGVAAVGGFAAGIWKATSAAMDMEQQLANIQASMSLSSDQTAKLKTLIEDLGLDPKLQVSATEAAAAIEMLGKNGLTVEQIMGGAARATVLLANATGGDFALAADVATSAMQAFNIPADRMDAIVSNISGSLVQSKFDINDYALALAQGGGVAAAVGVSFEDFNAVIAGISPLFGSGSDAGTSFKTMLQRLVPQSNDAAEAMRQLGLLTGLSAKEAAAMEEKLQKVNDKIAALDPTSVNYATNLQKLQEEQARLTAQTQQGQLAFFNADGSMRSMAEIAGVLNRALSGLSDEQKNAALSTIFGTDAMRAAVAVAQMGETGFVNLKTAIGKTDAEEQAATRMDTLKGKIEILKGVLEAISLRIGDKFIPAVKKIADWALQLITENEPQIDKFFGTLAERVMETVEAFVQNWPMIQKALEEGWKVAKSVLPNVQGIFEKLADWFTSTNSKRPLEWLARFIASGAVTFKAMGDLVKGVIDGFKLLGEAFRAAMRLDFGEVGNLSRRAWDAFAGAGMTNQEMDRAVEDMLRRIYGNSAPVPAMLTTGTSSGGSTVNINGNIIVQGTGSNPTDLRNAVQFANALYG